MSDIDFEQVKGIMVVFFTIALPFTISMLISSLVLDFWQSIALSSIIEAIWVLALGLTD